METIQALRDHVQLSNKFEKLTEFLRILDTAETHLKDVLSRDKITKANCVDIEGIDGVGKTTLANALAGSNLISGSILSVSAELKLFRPYFDEQNESTKRHFFHLWDIEVSSKLNKASDETIIILDRYWPTTAAYSLANRSANLTSNEEISWPQYLVQPSHIFYLHLNEEERCRRIDQRQTKTPVNDEERRIASDLQFRSRLDQIYRSIPGIYPIDSNQSIDKIVGIVIERIRNG
ncbi:unnamed protein product [Adineta ricciae]|uniref:Thymidylate kinase-like domain-containing protein n=1 Tax=Adineta ricciae TaxID=249248 RepID=A0A814ZV94_ADIRI|nr:unnamed protein product [Adineta ricciae]